MLAEVAGLAGFDYVVIDMQHGLSDYGDVVGMLQALARTPAVPLVRVPWNEPGIIGRVLDAGALGVIIPLVNSADEARCRRCRLPLPTRWFAEFRPARCTNPSRSDLPRECQQPSSPASR